MGRGGWGERRTGRGEEEWMLMKGEERAEEQMLSDREGIRLGLEEEEKRSFVSVCPSSVNVFALCVSSEETQTNHLTTAPSSHRTNKKGSKFSEQ